MRTSQDNVIALLLCIIAGGILWIAHSLTYLIGWREALNTAIEIIRDGVPPEVGR